jgi:hypothetical protein
VNLIFDQRDERELTRHLDSAVLDIERGIMQGLSEGAEMVADRARTDHEYTRRSGDLERNTVDVPAQRKSGGFEAAVAARTPYARYIEEGTAPHGIKPRSANGMLKFQIGGRWISKKFVFHPGTKAYRFLQNAIDAMQDDVAERVEARVLEAAAKAGFEIG